MSNIEKIMNDAWKIKDQVNPNSDKSIIDAIKNTFSKNFKNNLKNVHNPYGSGNSSEEIIKILKDKVNHDSLLQKRITF